MMPKDCRDIFKTSTPPYGAQLVDSQALTISRRSFCHGQHRAFLLLLIFLFLPSLVLLAGEDERCSEDRSTTEIYFRCDYRFTESDFRGNGAKFDSLRTEIKTLLESGRLGHVNVVAYASPEYGVEHNYRLAENRTKSLLSWLEANTSLQPHQITYEYGGIGWNVLREQMASSELWYSGQVLDLIDKYYPDSGNRMETDNALKDSLFALSGGKVWRELLDNYFPDVRVGLVTIYYIGEPQGPQDLGNLTEASEKLMENLQPVEPNPPAKTANSAVLFRPRAALEYSYNYIAPKTNLLYDAATVLNIGLEVPVGSHFSLEACWVFPWWLWEKHQNCLEYLNGSLEVRYYFKPYSHYVYGDTLHGWFVGVGANAGLYDFEKDKTGLQGEFASGSLAAGYVCKLSNDFSFEFSANVGYVRSVHRDYEAKFSKLEDRWHLIWQRTGYWTWIGPTELHFSLLWHPHFKFRKSEKK